MKKLILAIALLIPAVTFSQGYTGDYFRARNYVKSPLFLQGSIDTLSTRSYVDLMYDSTFVHTGSFSRCDAYNVTSVDTWLTLKLDTMCAENTTSGFAFNSDSTGIVCYFNGAVQISGHARLLNNSSGSITTAVYLRLRKNGTEISQFNTAVSRAFPANGAHDLVSVTGFINVNYGDVISVQGRFGNVNIDLQSVDVGIFDYNPSFTMYLNEIKKKNYTYPYLTINPSSIAFSHEAGTDTLFVTTNSDWHSSESLSWVSLSKTSGTGNDTILVSTTNNATTTNRTGSISINALGISRNCVVSQSLIEISPSSFTASPVGSTVYLSISTDISWSVSWEESWIIIDKTYGSGDDTITITIDGNISGDSRIGTISVTAGEITKVISINQI